MKAPILPIFLAGFMLLYGCSGARMDPQFKRGVEYVKKYSSVRTVQLMQEQSQRPVFKPSDWLNEFLSAPFQAAHAPMPPLEVHLLGWSFHENKGQETLYSGQRRFLVIVPLNATGEILVRGFDAWEGRLLFETRWAFPVKPEPGVSPSKKPADAKYDVYAASVSYTADMGATGGILDIRMHGETELYFDGWGRREALYVQMRTNTAGFDSRENLLRLQLDDKNYEVDYLAKKGRRGKVSGPQAPYSENQLTTAGAVKNGTREIAGKTCDLWTHAGEELCVWNGIPLLETVELYGKRLELLAVRVEEEAAVAEYHFNLPENIVWE